MNSIVETLTLQTLIVSSPQLNCSTQEIVRELWLLILPALVIRVVISILLFAIKQLKPGGWAS